MGIAAGEGYIDYSLGAPLDYVPMHAIAGMGRRAAARGVRRPHRAGRQPASRRTDRWRAAGEAAGARSRRSLDADGASRRSRYNQPGVLVHLQALRSHLGPRPAARRCPSGRAGCCAPPRRSSVFVQRAPGGDRGERRARAGARWSARASPRSSQSQVLLPLASVLVVLLARARRARRLRRRRGGGRAPAPAGILRRPGEPRGDEGDARRQPHARA